MEIKYDKGSVDVQGIGKSHTLKVKQSAAIYHIMSSGIYTNKPGAIIRELSCNAYDSHTAAGKGNVPIKIYAPTKLNPTLIIEDQGLGLNPDTIGDTALTYFGSSKQTTNDIGGFGVGAKSPLCYADQFTLITRWNGVEAWFTVFWNENGEPDFTEMGRVPTTEMNGVKVQMAVKVQDINVFVAEIPIQCKYLTPHPEVIGADINWDEYALIYAPSKRWAFETDGLGRRANHSDSYPMRALVGPVSYPVSSHEIKHYISSVHGRELMKMYNVCEDPDNPWSDTTILSKIVDPVLAAVTCGNIRLMFDINSGVEIQVSREALSYNETTISMVGDRIVEVLRDLHRYSYQAVTEISRFQSDQFFISKWMRGLLTPEQDEVVKGASPIIRELTTDTSPHLPQLMLEMSTTIAKNRTLPPEYLHALYPKLSHSATLEQLVEMGKEFDLTYGTNWKICLYGAEGPHNSGVLLCNSLLSKGLDAYASYIAKMCYGRALTTELGIGVFPSVILNQFRQILKSSYPNIHEWSSEDNALTLFSSVKWNDIKDTTIHLNSSMNIVRKDTRAEFKKVSERLLYKLFDPEVTYQGNVCVELRILFDDYQLKKSNGTPITDELVQNRLVQLLGLKDTVFMNDTNATVTPAKVHLISTFSASEARIKSHKQVKSIGDKLQRFLGFKRDDRSWYSHLSRRRVYSSSIWCSLGQSVFEECLDGTTPVAYVITYNNAAMNLDYEQGMKLYDEVKMHDSGGWLGCLTSNKIEAYDKIDMLLDTAVALGEFDQNTIIVGIPVTVLHLLDEEIVENWVPLISTTSPMAAEALTNMTSIKQLNIQSYPPIRVRNKQRGIVRILMAPEIDRLIESPDWLELSKLLHRVNDELIKAQSSSSSTLLNVLKKKYTDNDVSAFINEHKRVSAHHEDLIKEIQHLWSKVEQQGYFCGFSYINDDGHDPVSEYNSQKAVMLNEITPMYVGDTINMVKRINAWHRYLIHQQNSMDLNK